MQKKNTRKSGWLGYAIYASIVMGIALIPTWIYLLARLILQPSGFWQNVFLLGIGFYFLGFCQLVLLAIGLCFLILPRTVDNQAEDTAKNRHDL